MEGYTRSESARQHSFFYLAGYMISYLLHRLFADTCTVDMNGAAITITYYNEAPLTKVKPKNKKTCEHHSGEKEIIFHGHLLELYFLINSIKNIKTVLTEENGFVIITSIRFIFLQKRTKFYFAG